MTWNALQSWFEPGCGNAWQTPASNQPGTLRSDGRPTALCHESLWALSKAPAKSAGFRLVELNAVSRPAGRLTAWGVLADEPHPFGLDCDPASRGTREWVHVSGG